ncbi:lipopolysaccharide biosynthesis protein [Zunongwangia atlantica]|uniref:Polysaccharide biosynthesis protein n=1 Tax=Zunongwangia atlantica 22II14-10F7 TaxID=1185767 RepID=A0A1Y1SZM4_9FLAO|nr:hypothetical protein [Zunongwangia atlantica]ORL44197.1 hypothetical protein IIF7_16957 [Zunongwangia atlantica 22II14-10F7]
MIKALFRTRFSGLIYHNWFKIIIVFIAGQGAVQFVQLLSGFFLIHWLSVEDYAQYSIAFAFQSTAQVLVELGVSGSVVALVGNRINDKAVLGKYIKGGKFFRNRMLFVVSVICLIGFPYMTWQHGWPIHITFFLLLCILLNLFFSGNTAFYITPLMIHRKLKDIYNIQLTSGIFRLIFLWIVYLLSIINSWIAALTTCLTVFYNGERFREKSKDFIEEPVESDPETRKEILNYVKPVIPGIIYSAFSAQISLFIIGIFGASENIAEVGALGRLGQIFMIFNMASSTLVVPYLARQSKKYLGRKFLAILGIGLCIALTLITIGFVLPEPLLWIMGDKYSHLKGEVGLLILNSSIIFINVLMWDMNCSRKWLWSWIPIVSISSNILLQALMIFTMDLSTTYSVLIFSVILSVFNLLNKILVTIIGLNKTKNEINLLSEE